jgi:hypothetical protein
MSLGWLEAVDLYGYGLVVWIPAAIICIAPFDLVRWGIVVLAFLISGWFMGSSLKGVVREAEGAGGGAVINRFGRERDTNASSFMAVAHVALAIIFKTQFFSQSTGSGSPSADTGGASNATSLFGF